MTENWSETMSKVDRLIELARPLLSPDNHRIVMEHCTHDEPGIAVETVADLIMHGRHPAPPGLSALLHELRPALQLHGSRILDEFDAYAVGQQSAHVA